jgi:PAS domain S-box-containing protein
MALISPSRPLGNPRAAIRSRPELAALLGLLLLYLGCISFDWFSGDARELQIAFLAPVDALVVYSTLKASARCREVPWLRRFWLLVAVAWSFELVADLLLALYDLILGDPTFPSAADGAFLAFYPLLLVALLQVPHGNVSRSRRVRIALDFATILIGGATAVWYFLLGPLVAEGGEAPLEAIVSISYPVGDVLLLGALALVLVRGSPEALRAPLRWLAAGLVVLICADTIYGAAQLHGTYSPGDPVDALYVLMAAPFVLAAARQGIVQASDPRTRVEGPAEVSLRIDWLPFGAMLVGFGLLLATQWQDKFFPDLSLLFFAIALAALAAARQHFAQIELRQLQGRVQTIVDSVAEGIVTFDERGTIVWVNPAGETYFGAGPGELAGERVDSLFEGVSWKEMAPMVGTDGKPGPAIGKRTKFTGRRRDGAIFPAEIVVTEARLDGERVMISIGQDVSDRVRAETALKESERRFRGIFDSAGIGIAFSAFAGGRPRIVDANAAFMNMLDYSLEELLGNDFSLITHPDDLADLAALDGEVRDGADHIAREQRCMRKDGGLIWVALTVSILRDEDGEPSFAIGMLQDVTARKEAERVKDEFVSVVGHELRTPLTSIRGSLGLLGGGVLGELPPEARQMTEMAISNTDRLVRLVNDILDIERIDAGRIDIQPAPIPAGELVAQSVKVVQAAAEEAGVNIEAESKGGVTVTADADRIVQALTNLLGNAIKFSEPGGEIAVRVERGQEKALFTVQDHGRGIPPGKLDSIFDRFNQVDVSDAREKGGAGLGLSITRGIVELHGGKIWAESVEGKGATFQFTLPLAQAGVRA